MDYNTEEVEELVDDFTLTKKELEEYNVDATKELVENKIKDLKKARNRFVNGYHVRVTVSYKPRLEGFTNHISDPVGKMIENKLDSEQEYNEFNIKLEKLYSIMSKPEIAYINDCLICNKSEASVRDKFGIYKEGFTIIKASSIVRFALAFDLAVYK